MVCQRLSGSAKSRIDAAITTSQRAAFRRPCNDVTASAQKPLAGECLLGLAVVLEAEGDVGRAARLWGAGQAVLRSTGSIAGRTRNGEPFPEHLLAEGAALTFEEAITLGMSAID